MFLKYLNDIQQGQLLSLVQMVAIADNMIVEQETLSLTSLKKRYSDNVVSSSAPLPDLSTVFNTRKTKIAVLLELIHLAYVDNKYHAKEKELIAEIAKSLDISTDQLETLERWVITHDNVMRDADVLMG